MKTNKFEKTIRQKLESISPDFHEEDWTKMQNYMQVHTPPTFWQQYGSWLGYAAAASVSTVMAFLYVNQLSQNNNLVSDVKKLQNQIEVIKTTPPVISKADTIYIVQKELIKEKFPDQGSRNVNTSAELNQSEFADQSVRSQIEVQKNALALEDYKKNDDKLVTGGQPIDISKHENSVSSKEQGNQETDHIVRSEKGATDTKSSNSELVEEHATKEFATNELNSNTSEGQSTSRNSPEPARKGNSTIPSTINQNRILDENFNQLAEIKAIPPKSDSRQMNYLLANRMSPRQVKKIWLASIPNTVKPVTQEKIVQEKKVDKAEQTENVIPKLNLKVPYRFGGGIQFEGSNQVKTVLGEVLVAKKFSISAGVSWLKVKPMEFFTEKIFREKNRKDFKRSHPDEVPMAFEIRNINVKPTLVQIPLTVAFRNDLNHNFSYFVGAGTNITVKGREAFSFDCSVPYPNPQFISQAFERKMDIPVINSLNFSAGIEKTWHPIVVQIEGYLYTYFKPLSPDSQRTGPGVKLKVLYQIGGKM